MFILRPLIVYTIFSRFWRVCYPFALRLMAWCGCCTAVFMILSCARIPKPLTANPATITANFAGFFYDTKSDRTTIKSALTYWRKINPDGSKGDRFAIGGANAFNRAINTTRFRKVRDEVITLDAGTYYLDSFEIEAPKAIAISQKGDYTKREGWDMLNNKPRFLGFVVKEDEHLVLPQIVFKIHQSGEPKHYTQTIEILVCTNEQLPPYIIQGKQLPIVVTKDSVCDQVAQNTKIK